MRGILASFFEPGDNPVPGTHTTPHIDISAAKLLIQRVLPDRTTGGKAGDNRVPEDVVDVVAGSCGQPEGADSRFAIGHQTHHDVVVELAKNKHSIGE